MADPVDPNVSLRTAIALERIADALEKHNEFVEKTNRCPGCLGTTKGYGNVRCIQCGGTGVKQR